MKVTDFSLKGKSLYFPHKKIDANAYQSTD